MEREVGGVWIAEGENKAMRKSRKRSSENGRNWKKGTEVG